MARRNPPDATSSRAAHARDRAIARAVRPLIKRVTALEKQLAAAQKAIKSINTLIDHGIA